MNAIRKFLLLAGTMFLTGIGFVNAQTSTDYDPKAKTILDDVAKTAKSYTSITATFTVTSKQSNGTSDVRNGTAVTSGGKYKYTLKSVSKGVTYTDEYYNDGTTTWVYADKADELTVDDAPSASTSNDNITPNNIFTFYEKGFKYTFVEEKTVGGKVLQYINLSPEKAGQKKYTTIKLAIDKVKKQLVSITILNEDGSSTIYEIGTLTPNLAVTDATFQFDKTTHTVKTVVCLKADDDCDK